MSTISNAASYMDGGAAHPLQKAAIPLIRDLGFVKYVGAENFYCFRDCDLRGPYRHMRVSSALESDGS